MGIIKTSKLVHEFIRRDEEGNVESITTALDNVNLDIKEGQFIAILGHNGSGKSTLAKHINALLAPSDGTIWVDGMDVSKEENVIPVRKSAGMVFQNPDNQIIANVVEEDVGFGPENIGVPTDEIWQRVDYALRAVGMTKYRTHSPNKLSGGQKQLLNLAAIMAMHPSLLILDEPTSQLDPIAASDFLETVKKINRDIGTTVIITEHRLQDIIPYADKVFVLDKGTVFLEGRPSEIGQKLREQKHGMFLSMPVPMQIYGETRSRLTCPLTVSQGRQWIQEYIEEKGITKEQIQQANQRLAGSTHAQDNKLPGETAGSEGKGILAGLKSRNHTPEPAIQMKGVWFRYEKDSPDVVRDLSLEVKKGEFYALVGGNGTGKSTTLSLLSRVHQPYKGRIYLEGKDLRSFKDNQLYCGYLGVMPQNPQSIFLKKTVLEDLYSVIGGKKEKLSKEYNLSMKKEKAIEGIVSLTHLNGLLDRHPYDLSGGEQQRLATA